ncbi:hypothetical protein [Massilia sp.]|uniref:hypothetical protein n=1 Tax=Massilia sp. TaxID=1882437 RepID=UPI0028A25E22|nr:hypothetical protein [Massilia sp.]
MVLVEGIQAGDDRRVLAHFRVAQGVDLDLFRAVRLAVRGQGSQGGQTAAEQGANRYQVKAAHGNQPSSRQRRRRIAP